MSQHFYFVFTGSLFLLFSFVFFLVWFAACFFGHCLCTEPPTAPLDRTYSYERNERNERNERKAYTMPKKAPPDKI